MNPAKRAAARTVKFVADHRVAIAIVTTAATTAVVVRKVAGAAHDNAINFIESEGLLEKFNATFEEI